MCFLPRTVLTLGFVSLLNDAASEMVTPLLPIFLTAVLGAGPSIIGLIEGLAESTASILKLVAGRLADRGIGARRLVIGGYAASNAVRPLIGLALGWSWVLLFRFLDRVGKGIRTAPRDALIAGAVDENRRGAAFGFHRSMDHAGAVIGPLLAYLLLATDIPIATVFYWSAIPGVLVVAVLLFGLPREAPLQRSKPAPLEWRVLDVRLRALIVAAAVLAFAAVPEVFVVLWAKDAGLQIVWVPLLWALASLAKMTVAMPAGLLSDRVGRLPVLLVALTLRVAILIGLATIDAKGAVVWILFLAYAISLAISEPAERALVGDHAGAKLRGTAFGLYHLAGGLLALPGAFAFGLAWEYASSTAAFLAASIVTALAAGVLVVLSRKTA